MKHIDIIQANSRIARLSGLMLIAILTMSALVASTAAALPEFKPSTKNKFQTTGLGNVILTGANGTEVITCTSATDTGEITNAMEVGNIIVHFSGCTSNGSKGKTNCPISTPPNANSAGLILTVTLHGILGLILPVPAEGSDVGLLLLPHTGKFFVTLLENDCTLGTKVEGNVASVAEPVGGGLSTTGKLLFNAPGNVQQIKELDTSSGLLKPSLKAFGTIATAQGVADVTSENAVEVT